MFCWVIVVVLCYCCLLSNLFTSTRGGWAAGLGGDRFRGKKREYDTCEIRTHACIAHGLSRAAP